jgi:hypothetical protein
MKNLFLLGMFALILASCSKKNEIKDLPTEDGKAGSKLRLSALANYYVNGATGNDANAGTSAATALKTIQAALYKTTNGVGANIYVAAGTYKERLYWPTSGASSAEPITLTNYNNGVVILDGINATNNAQNEMLAIASRSHIRINNISITNNTRANAKGIYVVGNGTDIQVTYCKISNIGWTTNGSATPTSTDNASPFIIVGSTSTAYTEIYIGSNEIFNCNTGYSEGLTLTGNVQNFLIEMNSIHDIKNIGMDMSGNYSWTGAPANVNYARNGNIKNNTVYNCVSPVATSGGIYVDGGKWINIEGNTCYANYAGISVGCENNNNTVEGINIRSNFIYNNIEAGLLIGSNQPNSKVINSTVSNNTLFKNYSAGGWGGEISMQNMDNVKFIDNIINSRSNIVVIASLGYVSTNLTFNYNKYYTSSGVATNITFDWGGNNGTTYSTLAAFKTGTGLDANSTYGTPGFVSSTLPSPNLHLTNTSACVNAGLPTYALQTGELDIDKAARIVNSRVDIGADESVY